MTQLQDIADSVAINGKWSKVAMKRGHKWLKAESDALNAYLLGVGFDAGNISDWQEARCHYKKEVEALIND